MTMTRGGPLYDVRTTLCGLVQRAGCGRGGLAPQHNAAAATAVGTDDLREGAGRVEMRRCYATKRVRRREE